MEMGGISVLSTSGITIGEWRQLIILADTTALGSPAKCLLSLYFGADLQASNSSSCTVSNSTTDILLVGGYIGQMQDLLLFSPSSAYLSSRTAYSLIYDLH